MFLSWLMPMQMSPDEGGIAEDKPDDQNVADDTGVTDDADKGGAESPKISEEDLAMLKKADIEPDSLKLLDQAARDKVIAQLKKGAEAWLKVYEADKAKKEQERSTQQQALALAQANLIGDNGKPDLKAIKTLSEQAGRAQGLETLLDTLTEFGHISETVANVIKSESPEIAAAVLKRLQPETADVESRVEAILKRKHSVNNGDRAGGGQVKPEDEEARHQKEIEAGFDSLTGKRKIPGVRS